jgi:O-methyltransferase involved in polyketide biosynthesis
MYLGRDAVMQTLRFVAETCARGSQIVFDFSLPDALLGESERIRRDERARKVASFGEPWISTFHPEELASDLKATGFSTAVALAARDLNGRYFLGRSDGLRVIGSSGRIMSARV